MIRFQRLLLLVFIGLFSLVITGCSDDEDVGKTIVVDTGNTPAVEKPVDSPAVDIPGKIPVVKPPTSGGGSIGGSPLGNGKNEGNNEATDQNDVIILMEEYLVNFEKAVNDGAFFYIQHLIDPTSQLYDEQVDYVLDMYERKITEKIINYEIGTPVLTSEETYEVTTLEAYNITYGNENREELKNFENVYTVKKFDGVWLISDLTVYVVQ